MFISIIGSAGRKEDGARWTPEVYYACLKHLDEVLLDATPIQDRMLISGGAAWADHLAVSLFLQNKAASLDLHIPCYFCPDSDSNWANKGKTPCFLDTGKIDWKSNPGGTLNYYHRQFSQKMGKSSLRGIGLAREKGATFHDLYQFQGGSPLHARNEIVACCDFLIAFTWGEGKIPKDGGTKHTWDHSSAPKKIHIPLSSMI